MYVYVYSVYIYIYIHTYIMYTYINIYRERNTYIEIYRYSYILSSSRKPSGRILYGFRRRHHPTFVL